MNVNIGSLGVVTVEINACELCGRMVEGYKLCEECRMYLKIWFSNNEISNFNLDNFTITKYSDK